MEDDNLKKLKVAVHFTVGKLCEEIGSKRQKTFSKEVIQAIANLTFDQCLIFAKDLELFAKHGKRRTVNDDDVKLLVRRNDKLSECIQSLIDEMNVTKQKPKATIDDEASHDGDNDDDDVIIL
ncbi:Centromere protein S [Chamberlinius hualienensis]